MRKKRNKAFTITELVIVIAVIAILAAVLIPTFIGIIDKANLSADKAAIRDMNTALSNDEILNGKPSSASEVMIRMKESGMDFENYKPLSDGYLFMWLREENRIVLVQKGEDKNGEATYTITYPDQYVDGETYSGDDVGSGYKLEMLNYVQIETDKETVESIIDGSSGIIVNSSGASVALNTASEANPLTIKIGTGVDASATADEKREAVATQMASVAAIVNGTFTEANSLENVTLALPAEVDMIGKVWAPIGDSLAHPFAGTVKPQEGEKAVVKNLSSEGYTVNIDNITTLQSGQAGVSYGFIGVMSGGTVENITLKSVHIDLSSTGIEMGALVGLVNGKDSTAADYMGDVVIRNCTVGTEGGDDYVYGRSKVGGIVGCLEMTTGQSATIEGCVNYADIKAVDQLGSAVRAGGVVGAWSVTKAGKQNIINCENYGAVSSRDHAGGILGHIYSGWDKGSLLEIENCFTVTALTTTGAETYPGLMVGRWQDNAAVTVKNCSYSDTDKANATKITEFDMQNRTNNAFGSIYPGTKTLTVESDSEKVTYSLFTPDNENWVTSADIVTPEATA